MGYIALHVTGLILGLCPANERRRYKVTPSLIGWAQTWNEPCVIMMQVVAMHPQGKKNWGQFQYKDCLSGYRIPIMKTRWCYDRIS